MAMPSPQLCPVAAVATIFSRWYLPARNYVIRWPVRTGQIRAAGKWFAGFYAAACGFWMLTGLALCLLLKNLAPSIESLPTVAPLAVSPYDFTTPRVALYWFFGSGCSFLVLGLSKSNWGRWPSPRLTLIGALMLLPVQVACKFLYYGSAYVFGVLAIEFSYPGVVRGGVPTATVPWQMWFIIAFVLIVWRGWSQLNPRIREFTDRLTDWDTTPFRPRPFLYDLACGICESWYRLTRGFEYAMEYSRALDKEYSKLVRSGEADRLRLEYLMQCRAFFEREGLHRLLEDDNPERRF